MNENTETLRQTIVGLADLIKEVRQHGLTAKFDMMAPGLLEEAKRALVQTSQNNAIHAA